MATKTDHSISRRAMFVVQHRVKIISIPATKAACNISTSPKPTTTTIPARMAIATGEAVAQRPGPRDARHQTEWQTIGPRKMAGGGLLCSLAPPTALQFGASRPRES